MSTNERLDTEAQRVLEIIENPEVAQALRQDKRQNLQYLKDHYGVGLNLCYYFTVLTSFTAYTGTNHRPLQIRSIPIHMWKLQQRLRLPLPFPSPLYRCRSKSLRPLG